jgi:hypothetical protein
MPLFVTDNITLKSQKPDLFFVNNLYIWKVKKNLDGEIIFEDNIANKLFAKNAIFGIVSKSNYRLLYDILYHNKKIQNNTLLFDPFLYTNYVNKAIYKVDKKVVTKEFNNFLKRSYLGYLSKDVLYKIGFDNQKIEPILIMMGYCLSTYKDNVEAVLNEDISKLLYNLSGTKEFKTELDVLNFLLKRGSELEISDIFSSPIIFKDKYNYLKDFTIDKGKVILNFKKNPILFLYYSYFNEILNIRDYLLNLKILFKREIFYYKNNNLYILNSFKNILNSEHNKQWLDKKVWENIYKSDYSFTTFLNPLSFLNIDFTCPICGDKRIKPHPTYFSCRNYSCKFSFDRKLPNTFNNKINKNQMIALLNTGTLFLKLNNRFMNGRLNKKGKFLYNCKLFYKQDSKEDV